MEVQNRSTQNPLHLNLSNLLCRRIAVRDPIAVIDKDNPLFHGGENGFQNGEIHISLMNDQKITRNKVSDKRKREVVFPRFFPYGERVFDTERRDGSFALRN